MKKREFLKLTGIVGAGMVVSPLISCNSGDSKNSEKAPDESEVLKSASVFELPALGYAFDALQPSIDARTMEIHYGKHHAGYVKKLNAALSENAAYNGMTIEEILANVNGGDTGVRNNSGGHWNHSLYWDVMTPGGGNAPSGQLAEAMNSAFTSIDNFTLEFSTAGKKRFGSGWAWLCVDAQQKLFICSSPNQDNPLMSHISEHHGTPILGVDVWEHAYYLNYQNRRGDYLNAFMEVINWDKVSANFTAALS